MKSILFTPGNVKAIYDDLKWQTRRKINHFGNEPHYGILLGNWGLSDKPKHVEGVNWEWTLQTEVDDNRTFKLRCHCKVGTILYVKESYYAFGWWNKDGLTKSGKQKWEFKDRTIESGMSYVYPDTLIYPDIIKTGKTQGIGYYKRTPLFMPEKAARLFLEITNIRVEKLGDISEQDAIAEGCENAELELEFFDKMQPSETYTEIYKALWESIHGPGSWNLNPWVFAYDFKRVEKHNK